MYTILAVDDAKDTLILLEQDLIAAGYRVVMAESGEAAMLQLEKTAIDMVLLDMYMPGMTGLEVLQNIKLQNKMRHIPIIMLSASNDDDQFVAALEFGADDFVNKPYIAKLLLARIRNSFRLMEKTQELEQLAKIDFLTGVNNRGNFESLVGANINQCRRMDQNIVLAIFDLDYFKSINDTYGHSAGDQVLVEFSKLLSLCFREYDVIGRVGGEEFGVCLPNTTMEDALEACERLRSQLSSKRFKFEGEGAKEVQISVSAGLASEQGKNINYEKLFRKADCALYKAKDSGRNKILVDCVDLDTNKLICNKPNQGCIVDTPNQIAAFNRPETKNSVVDENMNDFFDNNNIHNDKNTDAEGSTYPGIDFEIGVGNVLGDEELFIEILQIFVEEHGDDAEKLLEALKESDHDSLKNTIHTLKGVACSIGAMALFEVSRILDVAVNEGKVSEYERLSQPVIESLSAVVAGIKTKL